MEEKKAVFASASFTSWSLCPICFECFEETGGTVPLLLHCGHTVCSSCLGQIREKCQGAEPVLCPICRSETKIKSITDLKKNFALLELQAQLRNEHPSLNLKSVAEPCEEDSSHVATLYCKRCNSNLCEDCFAMIHKPKVMQGHPKIPIDQKPSSVPSFCSTHEHYPLDLYCIQDKQLICIMCKEYGAHKGHEHDHISAVNERIRDQLKKIQQQIEQYNNECNQATKAIGDALVSLDGSSQAALKVIEGEVNKLIEAIKKQGEDLTNEVKDKTGKEMARLEKMHVEVMENGERGRLLIAEIEMLNNSKDNSRVTIGSASILKKFEALPTVTTIRGTSTIYAMVPQDNNNQISVAKIAMKQPEELPGGQVRLIIKAWGAGGGGGQHAYGNHGGAGGYAEAEYDATVGEVLRVVVGMGGTTCTTGNADKMGGAGLPNGGNGRGNYNGGGGGGSSHVLAKFKEEGDRFRVIVGAGGGGGASGGMDYSPGGGGGGGTSKGEVGTGGDGSGANSGVGLGGGKGLHGGGGGGCDSRNHVIAPGGSEGGGGVGGKPGQPGACANGAGGLPGRTDGGGGGGGGGAASFFKIVDGTSKVINAVNNAAVNTGDPDCGGVDPGMGGLHNNGAGRNGRVVIINKTTGKKQIFDKDGEYQW